VVVSGFSQPNQLDAFAVTAPGLEPLCAAELNAIGIAATAQEGGVAWSGDIGSIGLANLWSRTASRVIVRLGEFRARTFFELERNAKRLPWDGFIAPNGGVAFRVTSRKSKLYHSDAVAQRLAEAALRHIAGVRVEHASSDDDDSDAADPPAQLFVVRVLHDVVTVSADSSGALLHFRGYRQQLAKAPLRETLAAALLLGADWGGDVPLLDPMCGSGTIPIEAARLARRIAPGRDRSFAFARWPCVAGARCSSRHASRSCRRHRSRLLAPTVMPAPSPRRARMPSGRAWPATSSSWKHRSRRCRPIAARA
jgi:putative N6-adenine-specific DNA methylase